MAPKGRDAPTGKNKFTQSKQLPLNGIWKFLHQVGV